MNGSSQDVDVVMIAIMTVVPFLLGAVIVLATRRWAPRAWHLLAWAGLVLGLISLAGPLLADATTGSKVALSLMHLSAATAWFAGLRAYART